MPLWCQAKATLLTAGHRYDVVHWQQLMGMVLQKRQNSLTASRLISTLQPFKRGETFMPNGLRAPLMPPACVHPSVSSTCNQAPLTAGHKDKAATIATSSHCVRQAAVNGKRSMSCHVGRAVQTSQWLPLLCNVKSTWF
jgi:hypothetical protein